MTLSGLQIAQVHALVKAPNIGQRYLPPESLIQIINRSKKLGLYQVIGKSFLGRDIGRVTLGHGSFVILAWSQMHGNESTTTRALVDIFQFLTQREHHLSFIESFLASCTLNIVFQLNPDGAKLFTRENATGYDINRDAIECSQPESKILKTLIDHIKPNLCLNCHDQRSLYSLDDSLNPPNISFLAPSIDEDAGINKARFKSINWINNGL